MLSACIIARDEEANITDCLTSLLPVADEIVVLDTGSKDKTVSLAKEVDKRVRVYDGFTWNNDFAAARNACQDKAKGAWIFMFDCDDRLPPESIEPINTIKSTEPNCYYLPRVRNIRPMGGGGTFNQVRIFPNRQDIRWHGRIHEQIGDECVRAGLTSKLLNCEIHHTGYSNPETFKRKCRRNIEILLEEAKTRIDAAFTLSIGDAYIGIDNHTEAMKYYVTVYKMPGCRLEEPDVFVMAMVKMAIVNFHDRNYGEAKRWSLRALAHQPGSPYALTCLGDIAYIERKFTKAIEYYAKVLPIQYRNSNMAIDYEGQRMRAALNIARCSVRLGNFEIAIKQYRALLGAYPGIQEPWHELGSLYNGLGRIEDAHDHHLKQQAQKMLVSLPDLLTDGHVERQKKAENHDKYQITFKAIADDLEKFAEDKKLPGMGDLVADIQNLERNPDIDEINAIILKFQSLEDNYRDKIDIRHQFSNYAMAMEHIKKRVAESGLRLL